MGAFLQRNVVTSEESYFFVEYDVTFLDLSGILMRNTHNSLYVSLSTVIFLSFLL